MEFNFQAIIFSLIYLSLMIINTVHVHIYVIKIESLGL